MSDIRILPAQTERVESGPIQFGNDWPGVFIRGDNAGYFAMMLKGILEDDDLQCSPITRIQLQGLQRSLGSAVIGPAAGMVTMPAPTLTPARLSRLAQRDHLVRHSYGGIYSYIGEATHTTSKEPLAVYEHVWPFEGGLWARPLVEYTAKFTDISRAEVDQLMAGDRVAAQQLVQQAKEAAKAGR